MTESSAVHAESRAVSVWLVALALACVPAVIVGFGRFAYGVVLPAMKADLGLSFAQMGALNTSNALGYLGGALVCAPLTKIVSERQMIIWGVALSVVALWLTGLARSFEMLLALRALIGITAAFGNIAATGMATRLVGKTQAQSALALGIVIAGPGLGVIFTGLTLPFLLEHSAQGWSLAWEFMAVVGAVISISIFSMLRHVPKSDDLKDVRALARPAFRPLWPAFAAYFLFGLGYIAYMTFLVAYVRKLGATPVHGRARMGDSGRFDVECQFRMAQKIERRTRRHDVIFAGRRRRIERIFATIFALAFCVNDFGHRLWRDDDGGLYQRHHFAALALGARAVDAGRGLRHDGLRIGPEYRAVWFGFVVGCLRPQSQFGLERRDFNGGRRCCAVAETGEKFVNLCANLCVG